MMADLTASPPTLTVQRGTARANLAANALSSAGTTAIGLIMAPLYLRLLGHEVFGLLGLFGVLAAVGAVCEFGLCAAVGRRLAQAEQHGLRETREAVAGMELVFFGIGLALGAVLSIFGPSLAAIWLNPGTVSSEVLRWSMLWLGVGFAVRWNVSFYTAGLAGLERQVGASMLALTTALVQYGGVVVVLALLQASPQVFFAFLACCGLLQMLILRWMLWRLVGWDGACRRWRPQAWSGSRSFAGGMTAITLTSVVLTQLDKAVLGRLMPLAGFGVYTFAANTAAGTGRVMAPIFNTVYPRLTRLIANGSRQEAADLYRLSAEAVAALLVPGVVVIIAFVDPILRVWTGDALLAAQVSPLLSAFLIGNLCNGFMHLPLAWQLAHGWTRLVVVSNACAIALLLPGAIIAYDRWGAVGVAGMWCLLNLSYLVIVVPAMHARLGRSGMGAWYLYGVFLPVAIAILIAFPMARGTAALPDAARVLVASCAFLLASMAVVAVSPVLRGWLMTTIRGRFIRRNESRTSGADP